MRVCIIVFCILSGGFYDFSNTVLYSVRYSWALLNDGYVMSNITVAARYAVVPSDAFKLSMTRV